MWSIPLSNYFVVSPVVGQFPLPISRPICAVLNDNVACDFSPFRTFSIRTENVCVGQMVEFEPLVMLVIFGERLERKIENFMRKCKRWS